MPDSARDKLVHFRAFVQALTDHDEPETPDDFIAVCPHIGIAGWLCDENDRGSEYEEDVFLHCTSCGKIFHLILEVN